MSTPPTVQIKKPSRSVQQPGALRNQASLEIQTRQAQTLLNGRTGPTGIVGLMQFSHLATDVWHAAARDDPYADWVLLRIEAGIDKARAFMKEKNLKMAKSLNALGSMKIGLASTQAPAVVDLSFGTPYGFMGAYLLSDYDELTRSVLTAKHCALLDRDRAGELIRAGGNAVRSAYQLPTAWRRIDITRDEVRKGSDAAANAAQLMGELPVEVLELKQRPKFAPRIVRGGADKGGGGKKG